MKKILIIIVILAMAQSCLLTKPRTFTLLYDGKNTGLDTIILMDGCYYNSRYNTATLFYKDGMFINSGVGNSIYDSYTQGIGWDYEKGKGQGPIFGRYILKEDTIIGQKIINTFTDARSVYTYKYLILSKNKIQSLSSGDTLKFVPIENRMDSTSWLLKKKWFWTKEAWKKQNENRR